MIHLSIPSALSTTCIDFCSQQDCDFQESKLYKYQNMQYLTAEIHAGSLIQLYIWKYHTSWLSIDCIGSKYIYIYIYIYMKLGIT
jgi:hypothetical protein